MFVRQTPTRPRAKGQEPHFTLRNLGRHVALPRGDGPARRHRPSASGAVGRGVAGATGQRFPEDPAAGAELVARARRELEEVGQQWWTPGHSGRHCTCWIQHQAGLQVLLHSPAVSLDNNIAERMLRVLVIVRLTTSARAATSGQAGWDEALAVMDAEPAGINPWTWTLEYLQACATSDRQPPADLRPVCLG